MKAVIYHNPECGTSRMGHMIEYGVTPDFFTNPQYEKTHEYITSRFG